MSTPVAVGSEEIDQSLAITEEPLDDSAVSEAEDMSATDRRQPRTTESKWHSVKRAYAKTERRYDRLVSDKWTYEILGILICTSTLLAIIAVLFAYRNSPSPRIMAGVSVRTNSIYYGVRIIDNSKAERRHIHTGYIF